MAITAIPRLDGLEDLEGFITKMYEMKDAKVYKILNSFCLYNSATAHINETDNKTEINITLAFDKLTKEIGGGIR